MGTFEFLRDELENGPPSNGVSMADVLDMPEPLGTALSHLLRSRSMTLTEFSQVLGLDLTETYQLGQILVAKGYISQVDREDGTPEFHVRPARMRGRTVPFDL